MLLRAIAVDYDGTIAENGILDLHVREAIIEARSTGLHVVIVTGRILRELRRVAGDLTFVDGVVAENGAVILLRNGHRRVLGPPPFPVLLHELRDRGIEFVAGRCLVDMDAEHAESALSIIRNNNLPLAIAFNHSRLMILPRSINKSLGLIEILNILGTSTHNTIGIGNAENDYELLKECEYGVAVLWAPYFLRNEADYILPGENLKSVAEYISQVSHRKRLPVSGTRHYSFTLESKAGQTSFEISNRGRNILIFGDSKSGKSRIAGLFCEQMILQRYTVMVIDPEGDYGSLAFMSNTLMLGGGNPLPDFKGLLTLLRQGLNIILNFSHLDQHSKTAYILKLLPLVAKYRRKWGYPHSILIDECHYFLHDSLREDLLDQELGSHIMVSYQPSLLEPKVLRSMEVIVATRNTRREEIDAIMQAMNIRLADAWYETIANLDKTEAALLPPTSETKGQPRRFTVAPRLTRHVRHRQKYFDACSHQNQAFVYTIRGGALGEPVYCLHDLVQSSEQMDPEVIIGHLRRHDFSRWIKHVFDDNELAVAVRELETCFGNNGKASEFSDQLFEIVEHRYSNNFAAPELNNDDVDHC